MKNKKTALVSTIISMLLFGPIGIVRKFTPLPSGLFASLRGIVGAAVIFIFVLIVKKKFPLGEIKKGLLPMIASGAMIGFNWILLFEAYNYTTVSVATLCYYMAPVIVILTSPLLFGEKLTPKKILCVVIAFAGMVLVSGILSDGISGMTGIFMGLGAAVLYSGVIIVNKFLGDYPVYEKTSVQMLSAGIIVLPYSLIAEKPDLTVHDGDAGKMYLLIIGLVLLAGILHTGLPYALYFGSMKTLPAQTVALISYIDPITAIILSAVILKEKLTLLEIIGAVLILGSMMISELPERKKSNSDKVNPV